MFYRPDGIRHNTNVTLREGVERTQRREEPSASRTPIGSCVIWIPRDTDCNTHKKNTAAENMRED